MAMKKGLKARWVAALRSGKYKQGTRELRKDRVRSVQHCCLGVLCEISPKIGALPNNGNYYLGPQALDAAGLTDAEQRKLADLNDDGLNGVPYGFKRIANYIEKNL